MAALAALAIFMAWLYASQWIIRYQTTKEAVRIRLFGVIPLRRIKPDDIAEIRLISWTDTFPLSRNFQPEYLWAERWPSHIFQKQFVFIRKKTGLSRVMILSPRDPQQFVDMYSAKDHRTPGNDPND